MFSRLAKNKVYSSMQGQLFKPFRFVLRQYIQALTVPSIPKYVAPDHWGGVGGGSLIKKPLGLPYVPCLILGRIRGVGGCLPVRFF